MANILLIQFRFSQKPFQFMSIVVSTIPLNYRQIGLTVKTVERTQTFVLIFRNIKTIIGNGPKGIPKEFLKGILTIYQL